MNVFIIVNQRKKERSKEIETFSVKKEFGKYKNIDVSLFYENFKEDLYFKKEPGQLHSIILKLVDCSEINFDEIIPEPKELKSSDRSYEKSYKECSIF